MLQIESQNTHTEGVKNVFEDIGSDRATRPVSFHSTEGQLPGLFLLIRYSSTFTLGLYFTYLSHISPQQCSAMFV